MITDPDQTDRLREVIAEGEYYGMQTFDQALLKHYQAGRVAMEDALRVASSPHDFKLLVAGDGRTSTSMADLSEAAERSSAAGAGHGPAASPAATPPPPPPSTHSAPAPGVATGNGHSAPPPGFLS
jgi:twitching motility protein PilT